MIWLTRIDGTPFVVNHDHVVWLESSGDTIVSFVSGERIRVAETLEDVVERIRRWKLEVASGWVPPGFEEGSSEPESD